MVKLDRIYTRGGDGGETSLAGGKRVRKSSAVINALATIDLANSSIGMARTLNEDRPEVVQFLGCIQNDLFDLGADLARPPVDSSQLRNNRSVLRIKEDHVTALEAYLDRVTPTLTPLRSFILPGGNQRAASLHQARCHVRLAEGSVCVLADSLPELNPEAIKYLNRLSDVLFVMARQSCQDDNSEVLWSPGKSVITESSTSP